MGVSISGGGKKAPGKALAVPNTTATVVAKIIKEDTYLVLSDSAREPEDEYRSLYFTTEAPTKLLIRPPYEPKVLARMVVTNNILSQCVEAMEVNIDGTGYEFESVDPDKDMDPKELEIVKSFFQQPYPNQSFSRIRRKMRRELESQGFAFIEVLRTLAGGIACIRNTVSNMVRYVKLGEAVQVTKQILRAGNYVDLTLYERERAFVQKIGADNVYYREFGTTRHINRKTGEWESEKNPVPVEDRGTELLVFMVNDDIDSPYGIPRWINQMPSVIGSRKAEEQNLDFFDAGGMPPAIIFIQGGTMAKDMSDQLRMYLSGQAKAKNRAVIVEAQSTSGSLDAAGTVQVKVERFGAEKANDAMYAKYDQITEEHVRVGFRLPPLFLGKSADYNFATAQTAYMVAEAQVFQPERSEFDDYITSTIIRDLGVKTIKLKSNPITLKDVEQQLSAMGLVKENVETDGLVEEVNKIGNLTLKAREPEKLPNGQVATPVNQQLYLKELEASAPKPTAVPVDEVAPPKPKVKEKTPAAKAAKRLIDIAAAYAQAAGIVTAKFDMSPTKKAEVEAEFNALTESEQEVVMQIASKFDPTFGEVHAFIEGCQH